MSNYGQHNPGFPDQAQLDREAASEMKQQEAAMAAAFKVKADKDGHAHLFGFEIPEAVAPAINMAMATLMIPVARNASNFAYNQTKALAESSLLAKSLPNLAKSAPKVALAAELATMWGLFAARPIAEFVSANKEYAKQRIALNSEIRSNCEATGAKPTDNEVIRVAYRELHDKWTDDLKMVIPSVLATVAHATYGIKLQHEIIEKRTADIDLSANFAKQNKSNPKLSKQEHKLQTAQDKAKALAELRQQERRKFVSKYGEGLENAEIEAQFREHWDELKSHLKPGDDPAAAKKATNEGMNDLMQFGTFAGVTQLLGEGLASSMKKTQSAKGKQKNSYKLIMQLSEQMQGGGNKSQVHKAVDEIFQQLEEDMGRTRFAGGLAERLHETTEPIAEYIASGRLDALSLIKLAGESQVIEHGHSGKRSFKNADQIAKTLQDTVGAQVREEREPTAEDFLGSFANQVLARDTIKKNLAELTGEARDFFIAVIPTQLLVEAGLTEKQVHECRRCAHERLYDQVGSAVVHIAAHDDKLLKEYGLSTKESSAIKILARKIQSGDLEAVKIAVDGQDSTIVKNIAAAELAEQIATGQATGWAERVKESKTLDEKIDAIKAEKETKHPEAGFAEREHHKKHNGTPTTHLGA